MSQRRGCRCLGIVALLALILGAVAFFLLARTVGPSSACGRPARGAVVPGTTVRTLTSGGLERCYLLHVPPDLDNKEPAALVLSLHGLASQPEGHMAISDWNRIADREGFVVVHPQGTGSPLRWNASPSFDAAAVDDVAFIRDLVAEVETLLPLDRGRVYASGMSNGGTMVYRLACEAADLVAAVGSVAAPVRDLPEGCAPPRPVPLVAFHGTADPIVAYEGQALTAPSWLRFLGLVPGPMQYSAAARWTAAWAESNGCSPAAEELAAGAGVRSVRYTGCREGAEVLFFTIEGGGHTWPGGPPIPFIGETSTEIDASETMWEFFERYELEAPQE